MERTMRVVDIKTPGDRSGLFVGTRPIPTPKPGEILIKVLAAGVNRPDIIQRLGFYPPPPGASDIMGLEVSGKVEQAGEDADFRVGDEVMALVSGGGYAEYVVADAAHTLAVPKGLSTAQAACFPETAYTVWANVFEAGALKPGDKLFLHGATSGIGTMAVQMANAAGATVFGTAGSPEKCRFAQELGFAACYNYQTDDWAAEMANAGGADIVLDMVGGAYVEKNLSFLKPGGRHVSIGVQGGMVAEINMFDIMRRNLTVTGSVLRGRSAAEKARLTQQIERHVLPWIAAGKVAPVVQQTFALEDVAAAHELMESGQLLGKTALIL